MNLGCPTILIIIGNHNIHWALLDLGVSVNLLPFTVYRILGLRKLKYITTILQLADCSTRFHRGIIEDIFIKVVKFIFVVNFIVLEIEMVVSPKNEIPVMLEQPFLATSNVIINCSNEKNEVDF